MDTRILEEFGLTSNEASIFLILVKKGAQSATTIAKETGLNRPYIYYALERLLEKGFISQIRVGAKQHFQSIPLDDILALQEERLGLFKKQVVDLKRLQSDSGGTTSVEVLKGEMAVRSVFRRIFRDLKEGAEHLIIGIDEQKMEDLEPIFFQKGFELYKKKAITERVIIKKGGKTIPSATTTTYRFLAPELIGDTAKIIYSSTVIDIIYGSPTYALITVNKDLADTARRQFEVFWKMASKNQPG